MQRLIADMGFSFDRPADAKEFWASVERLFTQVTAVLQRDERLAALACGMYESAETRAALNDASVALQDMIAGLIAAGQAVGGVRADMPRSLLVDVLFGMALEMDRWFAAHWADLDEAEAMRLSVAMTAMLRAAASPPHNEGADAP